MTCKVGTLMYNCMCTDIYFALCQSTHATLSIELKDIKAPRKLLKKRPFINILIKTEFNFYVLIILIKIIIRVSL